MENALDRRNTGAAVRFPVLPREGILANASEIHRRRRRQAGISRKAEADDLDIHNLIDVDALVHGRETEFVVNKMKPGRRCPGF